jgi:hypothetical protein
MSKQPRAPESKSAKAEAMRDLRWLMSQEAGRRILWRWLTACGLKAKTYEGPGTSQFETFVNEGRRHVGIEFDTEAMAECPAEYTLMVQERIAAATANRASNNAPPMPAAPEDDDAR